eukprot:CAMPEP_0179088044 /NCGR_PEP_ID=MMETSP0796-20121207/40036_1 /TAXON_ID=73915 /ORGANISM="Pyrodinium bahamense, Strain pbaha01" /LENGTH=407 /DNA_ID=CAMNT_0020785561 /DNA_START=74 /DNA_END=1297 /DNA_ORIENTATION=-
MDASPDRAPCRWATLQGHEEGVADIRLVDLSPVEQVTRGRELLQLLRQGSELPKPSPLPAPATHSKEEAGEAEVQMVVRRTFIELVAAPPRRQARRRAQSESALTKVSTSDRPPESVGTSDAFPDVSEASTDAPSDHEETTSQQWCPEVDGSQWAYPMEAGGMPCFMDATQMGEGMPIACMAQCMPSDLWMSAGFEETGAMFVFPSMHVDPTMSWQWTYADPFVAGAEAQAFEQAQPTPSSASSGIMFETEEAHAVVEDASAKPKTTVLLRNLPTDFTRETLLELLEDEGFEGTFDFVYLPMDFGANTCLGYAFVNFVSSNDAQRCWHIFGGYTGWASDKVCEVTWGEPCQGLQAHLDRYRNSPVMHKSIPEEWKPLVFKDGVRAPFPPPTKSISAPKLRRRACKEG